MLYRGLRLISSKPSVKLLSSILDERVILPYESVVVKNGLVGLHYAYSFYVISIIIAKESAIVMKNHKKY